MRRWIPGRAPNYAFDLNRSSPQAIGLSHWWPLVGGPGTRSAADIGSKSIYDYAARRMNGEVEGDMVWEVDPFVGGWAAANPSAPSDDRIDVGTFEVTIPFTLVAYYKRNAVRGWAAVISGPDRCKLHESGDGAEIRFTTFDATGWDLTGPTISTGKFFVAAAVVNTPNDVDIYAVDDDGFRHANIAPTGSTTTRAADLYKLGQDYFAAARSVDGSIYDCRFYNYALPADLIMAMYAPATRWELYQPVADRIPLVVPAVVGANPKGVFGHPLHGPFAGPI